MNRRQLFKAVFILSLPALPGTARTAQQPSSRAYLLNRFAIAGFQYHDGPALFHSLHPGQSLTLTAEPDNPFDPFAVRIDFANRKLGYVPRSDNRHLSRLLRQDVRLWCRVLEVNEDQWPWRAVCVEVGLGS